MDGPEEDGERGSKGVGRVEGKEVETKGFSFWEESEAVDIVMVLRVYRWNCVVYQVHYWVWTAGGLVITCRRSTLVVKNSYPFPKRLRSPELLNFQIF